MTQVTNIDTGEFLEYDTKSPEQALCAAYAQRNGAILQPSYRAYLEAYSNRIVRCGREIALENFRVIVGR